MPAVSQRCWPPLQWQPGPSAANTLPLTAVPAFPRKSTSDTQGSPPTFTKDIAPIVFERCSPCHRPSQVAPFSLLSYREVRKRAQQIADVTRRRYMPPWLPEPGFGEFIGERRLSDEEIELIARWVREGAPEGDPKDLPPQPEFEDGWRLGKPDLVVAMAEPYRLPPDGIDVFRNFVIPIPGSSSRFVRAVEIRPFNFLAVHHAIVNIDPNRLSRRLDERDTEPGFGGMDLGESDSPGGRFIGWVPGREPWVAREGMNWRLGPGTDLVLQVHMSPTGKPEEVAPEVGLYFGDDPPRRHSVPVKLLAGKIDIPAGEPDYRVDDRFVLPVDVEVLAIQPHAHYLGKEMNVFATLPDGAVQWLLKISDWDFNWQDIYNYRDPVFLPAGTAIRMEYSYDNTSANIRNPHNPPRRVVGGNETTDEMGTLLIETLTRSDEDLLQLTEAMFLHLLEKSPRRVGPQLRLGMLYHYRGDYDRALSYYQRVLRLAPDNASAERGAGLAYFRKNDTGAAIRHFQNALHLAPGFTEARANLAEALMQGGRVGEAIRHFETALEFDDASAGIHHKLAAACLAAGRFQDALDHFEEAMKLRPEWLAPLYGAARILATCPEADTRDPEASIELALKGVRITRSRNPAFLDILAAGYAAAGRFEEAVATAEEALRVGEKVKAGTLSARIGERLTLYRRGEMYIDLPADSR